MKAISIRQPWAWLIINGAKDIENRDWPTKVRGRVLVHASKGMTDAEYWDAADTARASRDAMRRAGSILPPVTMPTSGAIERGGIVGSVEICDCVEASDSPWFFGRFGFVLRDPRPLPFVPFKGSLGFFNVPDGLVTP